MTTTTPAGRREGALRDLAAQGAALGEVDAATLLTWAAEHLGPRVAVACSMADAVLPHLVSRVLPGVDVLFLDTGYHFEATLATRDAVASRLPVRVVDVAPRLSVAQQDAAYGQRLYGRDPSACCRMRKVEPLAAALAGYDAWVTGVRREEGPTRAGTPLVAYDERHHLVKLNPQATWTADDVAAYAALHDLPANPLLAQGYPSIGCAPCTLPVAAGDDPRSGRWAGFGKTECGIHT